MRTVVGLFRCYQDAEHALHLLAQNGFSKQDISIIVRNSAPTGLPESGAGGLTTSLSLGIAGGAALGWLGGLLAGVGALTLPGIGPVLAAGTLTSAFTTTVAGAGVGAVAGGLIGALIGLGIPEEDAHVYAESIKRGGVLVAIQADTRRADEAFALLQQAGALDVDSERESLRRSEWNEFDESAVSGG